MLEPTPGLILCTRIKAAGEARRGKLLISGAYSPKKDAPGEVSGGSSDCRGLASSARASAFPPWFLPQHGQNAVIRQPDAMWGTELTADPPPWEHHALPCPDTTHGG